MRQKYSFKAMCQDSIEKHCHLSILFIVTIISYFTLMHTNMCISFLLMFPSWIPVFFWECTSKCILIFIIVKIYFEVSYLDFQIVFN